MIVKSLSGEPSERSEMPKRLRSSHVACNHSLPRIAQIRVIWRRLKMGSNPWYENATDYVLVTQFGEFESCRACSLFWFKYRRCLNANPTKSACTQARSPASQRPAYATNRCSATTPTCGAGSSIIQRAGRGEGGPKRRASSI
jgi:hypothetical protein